VWLRRCCACRVRGWSRKWLAPHLATWCRGERALSEAGVEPRALDGIAVTCGPGLVGPLLVGVEMGKALAYALVVPCGLNHLVPPAACFWITLAIQRPRLSHLAFWCQAATRCFCAGWAGPGQVSWGQRDDAAGEAFDKVAKLLGLGYREWSSTAWQAKAIRNRLISRAPAWSTGPRFLLFGSQDAVATRIREHGLPSQRRCLTSVPASRRQCRRACAQVAASVAARGSA